MSNKLTDSAVQTENKIMKHLKLVVDALHEVTGLNLELEETLSWKDGKTMKYEVIAKHYGYVESFSDLLPAKQLLNQLIRMEIFARQLRNSGRLLHRQEPIMGVSE